MEKVKDVRGAATNLDEHLGKGVSEGAKEQCR